MKKTEHIYNLLKGGFLFSILLFVFWSKPVSGQTVQGLQAAAGIGDIRLYWSPFTSATSYTLYWGTSPNVYPGGNTVTLGNVIGYVHTGVTPGQKYYYNIVATIGNTSSGKTTEVSAVPFEQFVSGGSDDGFSLASNCLMDLNGISVPPAPQGFYAASSIGQNVLYWNPVSNAVSYSVYSSTNQGGPYTALVGTTSNRSIVDNSASVGTIYYYVVQANFNGGCTGGTSLEASASPFPQSVSGGSDDGFSLSSNCLMDLNGSVIPPAPSGFKVAGSIGQNVLYWDPVSNAVSYSVYSSTLTGGPYTTLVGTTSNRSIIDNTVSPGTTYYYVVQANFSGGCTGGISSEYAATPFTQFVSGGSDDGFSIQTTCLLDLTGQSVSPAPSGFHAASSIGQNMLYWDAVTNAVSYTVSKSLVSGGPYNLNVGTTSNRSIVDNTGSVGTTYYYVVQANFSGTCPGGVSSEASAAPFEQFVSGGSDDGFSMASTCVLDLTGANITITPINVHVASSIGNNILYWDAITNASSYEVLRSTSVSGPFTSIGNTGLRTYIDNSGNPGTTYYYSIQLHFSGGGCSGGISAVVDAAPFPQFISGGSDDGFVVASSGFFKSLGINPMATSISTSVYAGGYSVSCNNASDGTIDLTPSGGDPQTYSFIWSNGATTEDLSGLSAGTYSVTLSDNAGYTKTDSVILTQSAPLSANLVPQVYSGTYTVSCFGKNDGSVNLTATGGATTYRYLWSNGSTDEDVNSLAAGTYYVTVTDANNCTFSDSVQLTQPASMKINMITSSFIGGTQISCFGLNDGSINVSVTGGDSASYKYTWSNGATDKNISGLNAGKYILTVSDSSLCSATDSVQLQEPASLNATFTLSTYSGGYNIDCNGNSNATITTIPSGGSLNYSYLWSNGETTKDLTSLAAGTYGLTLRDDNACIYSQSISITEPQSLVSSITSPVFAGGYQISCFGDSNGSIDLIPSGGATSAYTYNWSNGSTDEDLQNLSAGTYLVTITDVNACQSTSQITLTEPSALNSSISSSNFSGGFQISCNGKSDGSINLSPSGGVAAYSFVWSNGSTAEDLSGLSAGNYQVTITDMNFCTETQSIQLISPLAMQMTLSSPPFVGGFQISCNGKSDGSVNMTLIGGDSSSYSFSWSNGETTQNLSNLQGGSYSVTVTDGNSCAIQDTIVLNEPSFISSQLTSPLAYNGYHVSCQGSSDGSISLHVIGGTPNYTYLWSNGSTDKDLAGISAGTYSLSVSDANGCIDISQITLTEAAAITSSISTSTFNGGYAISCYGKSDGSVNLTPIGGAASNYSFLWSNGSTNKNLSGLSAGTYSVTVSDVNGCTHTNSANLTQPLALSVNASPDIFPSGDNISCNGAADGKITLLITGGSSAYSFLWSNGETTQNISNLNTGTYSAIVTDANACSVQTNQISITEPSLFASTVNSPLHNGTHISCKGGSDGQIHISSNGGSPAYKYSLNGGNFQSGSSFLGLTSGSYTITSMDTNSCVVTNTIILTEPANPHTATITISGSKTLCNGDSVILSAGVANSYQWSNNETTQSITVKSSGFYSVTTTNANGCQATSATETISSKSSPTISIQAMGPTSFCQGGFVQLTASNANSYTWSNGSTSQSVIASYGGTYTVTAYDTSVCPGIASIQVTVFPLPSLPTFSQNGNLLTSSPASTYQWNLNGNPIQGATSQTYMINVSGSYSVTVSNSNGCLNTSEVQFISITSINEIPNENTLLFFPNPFINMFTLNFDLVVASAVKIELYDIHSKLINTLVNTSLGAGNHVYSFDNFSSDVVAGLYFVKMTTGNSQRIYKVVKLH